MSYKSAKKVEKIIVPRHKMPTQDPNIRIKNFKEVYIGYNPEMAQAEAERCLLCPKPKCVEGCPAGVDIPGFIKLIQEGDIIGASQKIKESNVLPAVCGRVCPQESLCEGKCVLGKSKKYGKEPVAIGNLQFFAADAERATGACFYCDKEQPKGKKVACIGCGPSSMAVAGDLIKWGYDVTIFEKFEKGGGILTYGIPEFRLPKEVIDYEIRELVENGVKIEYKKEFGKDLTLSDLKEMGFEAFFIGTGALEPMKMGISGEDLERVICWDEYLRKANFIKAQFIEAKKVTIIGGGNVAMDVSRTAKRIQDGEIKIVYRRAIEQLPSRVEEIQHAQEEGIIFKLLTNPVRFIGDENGRVKAMEVIQMRLGEKDSSGRARPIPIEGSEFIIETDLVILSIGSNSTAPLFPDLKLGKWNEIIIDENGKTNLDGVYSGGDVVTGSLTVINAIAQGRRAAKSIHYYLTPEVIPKEESVEES